MEAASPLAGADQLDNDRSTTWYAVSQIAEGNSCRTADVRADQRDAVEIANKAAAAFATGAFDCKTGHASVIPAIDPAGPVTGMAVSCPVP